ncbi:hypothetical protein DN069_38510 [Streptacidiphilus pinicola]|uniref:NAD(P)-binding domain-containing protein n=1 Tax=Streptacidiphilus pinicola TaxID=2219663 RepID=A0A2X0I9P8_9ACTN|nr:GDP-mannose 4,6-dehydratase [Streptacidiphilus pinicola]RAG80373.1 hypothetical protein DN069_38510 [Streptacidiphilus pinicola]
MEAAVEKFGFAAESHADQSFFKASTFAAPDLLCTQRLLDAASKNIISQFVHVSTDDVCGPWLTGSADESAALRKRPSCSTCSRTQR